MGRYIHLIMCNSHFFKEAFLSIFPINSVQNVFSGPTNGPTKHKKEPWQNAKTLEFTGAPGVIRTRDPRLRSIISPFFRFRRFRESSKIKGSRNRIFHVFHKNQGFFLLMPPQLPPKRQLNYICNYAVFLFRLK